MAGLGGPPGVRRLATFLVALAVLFAAAHLSVPRSVLLVCFVVFVIATTVWVRGQYVDSLDNETGTLPWPVLIGMAALGLLLVAVFWMTGGRFEGFGLGGVIIFYLALGFIIVRGREDESGRLRTGLKLLAAGLFAGGIGLLLLGRLSGWPSLLSVILLAVGVLVLPSAVALLSEEVIEKLARPSHASTVPGRSSALRRVGPGAGATVLVVVALAAGWFAGSALVTIALLVLGLLIVALASSTQADIAAVLAVVALLGVTPPQAIGPEALGAEKRSTVLVALGDSYMSGEGASVFYKGTDDGGENGCRRSPTAWAVMAAEQGPFDGLAFLACSGARTRNIRTDMSSKPTPEPQTGEPDMQLAQYRTLQEESGFTPGLVVLSIGGNDSGFSTIGLMCLAPGNCNEKAFLWERGLDQVETALRGTYAEVRDTFPETPVAVMAYPDPIYNEDTTANCADVALSPGDRTFITNFVRGLNGRVKEAAEDHGFYFVEAMQESLADSHLQLCDPLNEGRAGLNFIGLRSVSGIAEQRFNPANWSHNSLHPNERGHAAMLKVFQNWLASEGPLSSLEPGSPPDADEDTANPTPPCDLFAVDTSGCRPQGQQWALQQVSGLALRWGWVALIVALAAWTASVTFFAGRRAAAEREKADRESAERRIAGTSGTET